MPASYKAERPLTRSQYAKRRDQTTKEEVAKLKGTPEYKKFAQSNGVNVETSLDIKRLGVTVTIITLATVLLAASVLGKVPPTENLASAAVAVAQPHVEPPTTPQAEQHVEIQYPNQYSIIELTSYLKSTEIQLYAAQKENEGLLKALELERSKVYTCPAASLPTIPAPITSLGTLQWSIIGAIGLIISVCASVVFTNQRNAAEISKLRLENLDLASQLQEAAFEREMAEQSISILESELQRKMSQLAEAQSQHKKAATPVANNSEDATGSPRIRAVQNQKANTSPTPLSLGTTVTTPTTTPLHVGMHPHPQRTPDTLPPPPRQLVERFLEERGAIAIEHEQVQAWLEMESSYGKLQREVTRLRALVEGSQRETEEQKRKIEELSRALQEQKEAGRKAKAALKAVRAAGDRD